MARQDVMDLSDYGAILRRRKIQLIVPIILIMLISITVAYSLPPVYRSTATILIERQEIPEDLVETTVTGYMGERLQAISNRVMTHANLWKIAEKVDLYPEERSLENAEMIVNRMQRSISWEPVDIDTMRPGTKRFTATVALKISFSADMPEIAQKVTNELAALYLEENRRTRTGQAAEVSKFLAEETDRLKQQVSTFEEKLAMFKEEHAGQLPELAQVNRQLFENTQNQLMGVNERIHALEMQRVSLQARLAQTRRIVPIYDDRGERVLSLAEQRVKLAELLQKYSVEHPDVKELKRSIAVLEKSDDSPATSSIASNNPSYITLRAQLDSVIGELSAERARQAQLREKLALYEERLLKMPTVERDYLTLTRDYQHAVNKYQEVKEKQMQAELAEKLEVEQKGEKFILLEPAGLPGAPVKPNRLGIALLGTVLSFGSGLGFATVSEYMDRSVRGIKQVTALLQTPPIAVIPYIENRDDISRRWRVRIIVTLLTVGVIGLALYMAHLYWMPLNELWSSFNEDTDAVTQAGGT